MKTPNPNSSPDRLPPSILEERRKRSQETIDAAKAIAADQFATAGVRLGQAVVGVLFASYASVNENPDKGGRDAIVISGPPLPKMQAQAEDLLRKAIGPSASVAYEVIQQRLRELLGDPEVNDGTGRGTSAN